MAIKEPRQAITAKLSTPEEQEPLGLSEQSALTDMCRVTYATDGARWSCCAPSTGRTSSAPRSCGAAARTDLERVQAGRQLLSDG